MADAGAAFVVEDVSRDLLDAFEALRGNADRRIGMARTPHNEWTGAARRAWPAPSWRSPHERYP